MAKKPSKSHSFVSGELIIFDQIPNPIVYDRFMSLINLGNNMDSQEDELDRMKRFCEMECDIKGLLSYWFKENPFYTKKIRFSKNRCYCDNSKKEFKTLPQLIDYIDSWWH